MADNERDSQNFSVRFWENRIFAPTFETYSTNIRPSKERHRVFRHQFYKNGSISSRSLEGISKGIAETKMQIDNILKLLNDAAEYRSSESNIKLQWIMMIVTVLSLLVALSSMNNVEIMNKLKGLIEWLNRLLCSILSSQFLH